MQTGDALSGARLLARPVPSAVVRIYVISLDHCTPVLFPFLSVCLVCVFAAGSDRTVCPVSRLSERDQGQEDVRKKQLSCRSGMPVGLGADGASAVKPEPEAASEACFAFACSHDLVSVAGAYRCLLPERSGDPGQGWRPPVFHLVLWLWHIFRQRRAHVDLRGCRAILKDEGLQVSEWRKELRQKEKKAEEGIWQKKD